MDLSKFDDRTISAIYRVAKTRLRVFFGQPHQMIRLRHEMIRRGLK